MSRILHLNPLVAGQRGLSFCLLQPSFPVLGAPPSELDPNLCGRQSAPQLLSKTAFPTEWASLQVHGCASCEPSPAPSHCPHYSRRDRFLIHEGANSLHLSWVIHADSGARLFYYCSMGGSTAYRPRTLLSSQTTWFESQPHHSLAVSF